MLVWDSLHGFTLETNTFEWCCYYCYLSPCQISIDTIDKGITIAYKCCLNPCQGAGECVKCDKYQPDPQTS